MGKHYLEIYDRLMTELKSRLTEATNDGGALDDTAYLSLIESLVLDEGSDLSIKECRTMISKLYAKTRCRLGILQPYVEDDSINEIMINGIDNFFYEDTDGIKKANETFDSVEELEEIIRNIAAGVHREINEMNPILDARLKDGSRVNAVYKNIVADGPVLTIRKFGKEHITIEQMIRNETLTEQCADYLRDLVECGYNIFISGGTSSGKTTFLNALSDFIPGAERVIVIEDSRELMLAHIDDLVQMECHNANSLGQGQVSMEMLIRTSLRMRPDRIIVGEVRGREVADMLQAANTGHDGSMSTGHGNSVAAMLRRLETMYLMSAQIPIDAIRSQIVEGIDVMIHLGRLENNKRKVLEIQELINYQKGKYELNPLFELDDSLKLVATGNKLVRRSKLLLKEKSYGNRL